MAPRTALLLACGSFNPPTNMHLRLFELSKDHLNGKGIEVLGGIVSPVNDAYPKKSLIPSNHRIRMVELALQDYDFVKCSDWEAKQNVWTRTRAALEYYNKEVRTFMRNQGEIKPDWLPNLPKGNQDPPRLLLVCGGDLLETFSVPGLWEDKDILTIAKDFGLVVISREGSNPEKYIYHHDILYKYRENIHLVTERIPNDISSTGIRTAVKRGESIKFLTPDPVIYYIKTNELYCDIDEQIPPDTTEGINEYHTTAACLFDVVSPPPTLHQEKDGEVAVVSIKQYPADPVTPVVTSTQNKDPSTSVSCMTSDPPLLVETFDMIDPTDIEPIDVIIDPPSLPSPPPPEELASEVPPPPELPTPDEVHEVPLIDDPPVAEVHKDKQVMLNEAKEKEASANNEEEEAEDCSCTTTGSRSPTPVHFEITSKGVKVISDKESFL